VSARDNKAIVFRLFGEVWNGRDIAALGTIMAPTMLVHTHDGRHVVRSLEEEREIFAERFRGFTATVVTCDDSIAEGDKVAVRWTATAVNSRTREKLVKVHIDLYRIEDGRIVETWTCS
jgi:ketosteroid isomerase-like protein